MRCRFCDTEIAEKALICYRCGRATTDPKVAPPARPRGIPLPAALGVTAVALASLMYLVNHTNLGRAMRATAENPRVAALMGVKPDMVISATFIIGAALAAVAGVMWAANYGTVQHSMGFLPGLKAFTAAVLGGIGNLAGAVVGGVLLGLIEAIGAGYLGDLTGGLFGSHYVEIFAFLVLILVLTLRPSGLMGERVADRA